MNLWIIAVIAVCGAFGGLINVFIGDSGLHTPQVRNGVFEPGWIGVVFVGMIAAVASWASLNAVTVVGDNAKALTLTTTLVANALIVGFGGTKWWKSENEKDVLQKTAGIAANKKPNAQAAAIIATASPMDALDAAMKMQD